MKTNSFSTTLQSLRKEKKVTQEQLASHLGVSPQAVSKWENGSYPEGASYLRSRIFLKYPSITCTAGPAATNPLNR